MRVPPSCAYSAVTPVWRWLTSSIKAGGNDHSRPTITPIFVIAPPQIASGGLRRPVVRQILMLDRRHLPPRCVPAEYLRVEHCAGRTFSSTRLKCHSE